MAGFPRCPLATKASVTCDAQTPYEPLALGYATRMWWERRYIATRAPQRRAGAIARAAATGAPLPGLLRFAPEAVRADRRRGGRRRECSRTASCTVQLRRSGRCAREWSQSADDQQRYRRWHRRERRERADDGSVTVGMALRFRAVRRSRPRSRTDGLDVRRDRHRDSGRRPVLSGRHRHFDEP